MIKIPIAIMCPSHNEMSSSWFLRDVDIISCRKTRYDGKMQMSRDA